MSDRTAPRALWSGLAASLSLVGGLAVAGPALQFTEVGGPSGIDFRMTSGGTPSRQILEVNGGGVALFDYDRDGDLDLFFANGASMSDPEHGPGSRLYANDGNGKFRDVTKTTATGITRWAMGVAVGDYDDDGDDDLYVTCYGPNILLRNDVADSGRFSDVSDLAGVADPRWGTSAAFGDVDADGDLDLYVANYLEFDTAKPPGREGVMFKGAQVMAGPGGLSPQGDVLYENLGDGRFRDVTRRSGCLPGSAGYGLGVVLVDIDRDGRLDIFVGNDSTQNFLFRNLGSGKFKNIGVISGVAANYDGSEQATMGIAVGDVDENGFPDLFTTNFSSDTNTLHLNLDGKWFDDRTSQYGLAMVSRPFLSWGAGFHDFDTDGDQDLFIASGHVYPEAATHEIDSEYEQPLLLFERRGKRFHRFLEGGVLLREPYPARSVAFGDLDDDGDPDIVVTLLNEKVLVLRNDAPRRRVVVVEPRRATGGSAPGTRVELVGARTQRRWVGGGSYQSVDAPVAYFGLGAAAPKEAPTLRVTWPGGKTAEYPGIETDRRIIVTEGNPKLLVKPLRGRR